MTKTKSTLGSRGVCSALLLIVFISSAPSWAHQQKTAFTQVLFNPSTNNIEVMHRFYLHDAEHAATVVFGAQPTLAESAQSRELFSSYVTGRFAIEASLAGGASRELPLAYVGQEVDGQFLWVYQEVPDSKNIIGLTIINLTLRDVWPDQSNLVNIERDGNIQSLTFSEAAEVLSVELLL